MLNGTERMKASTPLHCLASALVGGLMTTAAEPWTLGGAIEFAWAHNPDARIAEDRIAEAEAGLMQANAAFMPGLRIQSSYVVTDNPMLAFGDILNQRAYRPALNFNNVPSTDDFNTRARVMVPLYAGGGNAAGRHAASANTEAVKSDNAAVRNLMAYEVARAFHTVLKTRSLADAAAAAETDLQEAVSIARKRFEAGALLKTDVLDVDVRLETSHEDRVRAENARTLAERAFKNLLGSENVSVDLLPPQRPPKAPDSGDFSPRPELAAALDREKAARAGVEAAKAGRRPRVSAFAGVDYDYGRVTGGDGRSYTAGLVAQWDVWDGSLTRGKIHEAEAKLDAARQETRRVKLALSLETEQARLNLASARERTAVTARMTALAEENAMATRQRFAQGSVLALHVIDAETALLAARIRRAEAEADEHIAAAALRKALGRPQVDPVARTSP
jgi:outer membrane protein